MAKQYSEETLKRARKIKVLIMDVDGVLSDGRLVYGNYGDELKSFDVHDGLGVALMHRAGIKCVLLTARASKILKRRAKELKIDKLYTKSRNKLKEYNKIRRKFGAADEEICFIGDDIIDVPVLKRVGLAACPLNAVEEARNYAHIVTEGSGGRGAVRELCELILKSQDKWQKVTAVYLES